MPSKTVDNPCAYCAETLDACKTVTCDSCGRNKLHCWHQNDGRLSACTRSTRIWRDGKEAFWDVCMYCIEGITPGKWLLPHKFCDCDLCVEWRVVHWHLLQECYIPKAPPPELLIPPKPPEKKEEPKKEESKWVLTMAID